MLSEVTSRATDCSIDEEDLLIILHRSVEQGSINPVDIKNLEDKDVLRLWAILQGILYGESPVEIPLDLDPNVKAIVHQINLVLMPHRGLTNLTSQNFPRNGWPTDRHALWFSMRLKNASRAL